MTESTGTFPDGRLTRDPTGGGLFSHFLRFFATGPDIPLLADKAEIDRLYRSHRIRVMFGITLCYGLVYTCRLALGMVKKPLIDGGIFTPVDLGTIGAALFYAYAFGKLFNGFLADYANQKRFLALGFLLTALANIFMGFTTSVTLAAIIWGLNGWFQSFGAPSSVVAMTAWFSNSERGRTYGVWSTAHSLGEGLTFLCVGGIVAALGWRAGFWAPGIVGVFCAFAAYKLVQDRPQTMGLPPIADWKNDHGIVKPKLQMKSVLGQQLAVLKLPAMWILGISSALNYMTRYAIDSWGVLYLQEVKGFSLPGAGAMLMLNTVAGAAGAILFGYMSDKWFKARRPPANLIFGVLEIAGLLLFFYGPATMTSLMASMVLFGAGLTALVTSVGGLFAVDLCPKRVAGAAMGVIGIFSYLGAALEEHVSGALIQKGIVMVDGVRHYDFTMPIYFWVAACVVSVVLATSLWNAKITA
jgi:OPA family sugar phosphate sensor protein UhpC-like MFS transporter